MRQVITEREEVHRMSSKNKTEVLIDGKIYTLSGYESEEYLQRVATYINNKLAELKKLDGYARLSQELKSILLELNVADDYFKAKKQGDSHLQSKSQKTTWKSSITNKFPACSISTGPFTSIPP